MPVRVFLSTVSDEFRAYRDQLHSDLTRHNVEVKVQEDFKDYGGGTLDKLDLYIANWGLSSSGTENLRKGGGLGLATNPGLMERR